MVLRPCPLRKAITGFINFVKILGEGQTGELKHSPCTSEAEASPVSLKDFQVDGTLMLAANLSASLFSPFQNGASASE